MASARNSLVFTAGVVGSACDAICGTRSARKIIAFFVVIIAEFRLWSGSQNRSLLNILAVTTQFLSLGHLKGKLSLEGR